jgi:glucosamine--fructose-6-phosphate aminotransferase (isomerizing)
MTPPDFRAGVLAQPQNLRGAATALHGALAEIDLTPWRHGTLVLSAIGASWHALAPAVCALRGAGRRAFAVPAAELADCNAARLGDAFVLVSQSGASTETVAVLDRLDGAPVLAVTARGDSPLARGATGWLPLGPLPDSQVSTLSYTATLQALGMLADALLARDEDGWAPLPDLVAHTLERCAAPAAEAAALMADVAAVDAVGGGPAAGTAGETALLVREALRLPAAAAETREYLHGPLEPVHEGFGCFVFGDGRERRLAASLASYGAVVALIGMGAPPEAPIVSLRLPRAGELATPVLAILPVQLVVLAMAGARDLPVAGLRRQQDDTKLEAPCTT